MIYFFHLPHVAEMLKYRAYFTQITTPTQNVKLNCHIPNTLIIIRFPEVLVAPRYEYVFAKPPSVCKLKFLSQFKSGATNYALSRIINLQTLVRMARHFLQRIKYGQILRLNDT